MISLEHVPGDGVLSRNFETIGQALNPPMPHARVRNSANISVTTGVSTVLTFNAETFDNGDLHSMSVNAGRLTASITGLYLVIGHVVWAGSAVGVRIATLRVNGTTNIGGVEEPNVGAGDTVVQSPIGLARLAKGDYVELVVLQNSGGNLNALTDAGRGPELSMVRLGGYVNQGT